MNECQTNAGNRYIKNFYIYQGNAQLDIDKGCRSKEQESNCITKVSKYG